MTYFEVKERLENLLEFREMYRQYIQFTNRENNPAALMHREQIRPLAAMTVDSLRRVKLGAIITKDAPSRGGRSIRVNLIKAIFRDKVIRRFSLDERAPLDILDKGIVKYRSMLWRQKLMLFNPLFWLYEGIGFVARLPLLIFRKAGYDTLHAETLTSVRLYIIIVQLAIWYLLVKWSTVTALITFDILPR